MTVEVAILNKLAVALAADSAVTTGFPGKERIFTSANKIFTLSKFAPVGVMIYGHVEHFAVPWETLIKEFRHILGKTRYPLLTDYLEEFRKFFSQARIVTETQQELSVLISCASTYAEARNRAREKTLKWTSVNIKQIFDDMEQFTHKWTDLDDFQDITYLKFVRKYNHVIEAYIEDIGGFFDVDIPNACKKQFKHCVFLSMRISMPSSFASGIVVAGFGEDELFPTLKEIQVDGGIFDKVRIMSKNFVDIERSKQSIFVRAFAQEDVVNAFMQGFDDEYQKFVIYMLDSFMENYTKELLEQHTSYDPNQIKAVLKLVSGRMKASIQDLNKELLAFSQTNYIFPMEEVLRAAPKDELAHVAEALVSLTSLKRRVSGEKETVGGPWM